jgi:hypothetical protein
MAELTHADLERHHYQAVRDNPLYRLAGMMDVEMEWLAMNVPSESDLSELAELEDRVGNLEEISAESRQIPRRYYGQFQQIRGEVANLSNKVAELSAKKRRPVKSSYKGLVIESQSH